MQGGNPISSAGNLSMAGSSALDPNKQPVQKFGMDGGDAAPQPLPGQPQQPKQNVAEGGNIQRMHEAVMGEYSLKTIAINSFYKPRDGDAPPQDPAEIDLAQFLPRREDC